MKTKILVLIILTISYLQCDGYGLDAFISNDSINRILVFHFKNNDTMSYFIPETKVLSNIGDTLYIEAVYKRRDESYPEIYSFQFTPPNIKEIRPSEYVILKIDYKKIKIKVGEFIAVRFFTKPYIYNQEKNPLEYHSELYFEKFESSNSYLMYLKAHNVVNIKNW